MKEGNRNIYKLMPLTTNTTINIRLSLNTLNSDFSTQWKSCITLVFIDGNGLFCHEMSLNFIPIQFGLLLSSVSKLQILGDPSVASKPQNGRADRSSKTMDNKRLWNLYIEKTRRSHSDAPFTVEELILWNCLR